jgi:hypothetical protein
MRSKTIPTYTKMLYGIVCRLRRTRVAAAEGQRRGCHVGAKPRARMVLAAKHNHSPKRPSNASLQPARCVLCRSRRLEQVEETCPVACRFLALPDTALASRSNSTHILCACPGRTYGRRNAPLTTLTERRLRAGFFQRRNPSSVCYPIAHLD